MLSTFAKIAAALSVVGLAQAAPAATLSEKNIAKRSFDCSSPVSGLTEEDCKHMSSIGMKGQGVNSHEDNGLMWVGSDGANTFNFTNDADDGVSVTLIAWHNPEGDYTSSFMNVNVPQISYSLGHLESVIISMANGVSGGWAGLYNHESELTDDGQINNWWGEFTTGPYATVDITGEVNMAGNPMSIEVSTGCVADADRCIFKCLDGNTCGESLSYELVGCEEGSQHGATYGEYFGNPSGGCQGWDNAGKMDITFLG